MLDLRDAADAMTLTADDRLAIHELMARLHFAIDRGDAAALAAVFAEDGVFVHRDPWHVVHQEVVGRAAIETFGAFFADPSRGDAKHFLTNLVVTPQASGAHVACYILKVDVANGPTTVASALDDCLVRKVDGHWYLSRFDHFIDSAYANAHPRAN